MSVVPIKSLLNKQPLSESASIMALQSNRCGSNPVHNPVPVYLSKEHLARLWMRMTAIYGQLFLRKHGVEDKGVWFNALKDLTPRALESGMERLMDLSHTDKFCEFPPNCLQFRSLCLGFYSDLQLPTAGKAHREVLTGVRSKNPRYSHEVVAYTAKKLGQKFLDIENEGQSWAVFKPAYEQVCHLVRQGLALPEIHEVKALPKPKSTEVATLHLQAMRQLLGAHG